MTARSLSLSATRSFASSLTPETRHLIILVLVAIAIMGPLLTLIPTLVLTRKYLKV